MAAKKFIVELDIAERERLNALISKGKAPAKAILKARILLKSDKAEGGPGWLDAQIVEAFDTNLTMVSRHACARSWCARGSMPFLRAKSAKHRLFQRFSMARRKRS